MAMRKVLCAALPLAVLAADKVATSTMGKVQVHIYDGPTTCNDSEKVATGKYVTVYYTATIDKSSKTGEAGKEFASSDPGETFDFYVGKGMVVQGLDKGMVGLCKGAKATIIIPPEMGYGAAGDDDNDDLPGGATLNYDVEIVAVHDEDPELNPNMNMFSSMDTNKDNKLSPEEMLAWMSSGWDELPEGLMEKEDKNGDGFVSWEEFSGPKGDSKPSIEL